MNETNEERRGALSRFSSLLMFAGLTGGYGFLAAIAGRYLYPARPTRREWMYVTRADEMAVGDSLLYEAPTGETINVARQRRDGVVDDFIALSSVCPHLGCQVHWEAQNDRFFCPCHNGVFNAAGEGVSGPPGDEGLDLPRYPLKVEAGLLYIELPVERLSASGKPQHGRVIERVAGIHGPGHDPCLVTVLNRGRESRRS